MGLVEAVGSDHVFNAGDAIFASLEQAVAHARVDVASGSAEGKGTP
jgi:hypothetical protein